MSRSGRHGLWVAAAACGWLGCPPPPPSALYDSAAPLVPPGADVGPAPEATFAAPERFTLANGLAVRVLRAGRLPTAHFVLAVRGGRAADPPGLPGLADFTARMLQAGTRRRTGEEVQALLEDLGGTFQVRIERDAVYHGLSVPSEHAGPALAMLAEIVAEPAFPEEEIERHRQRERARLALREADPDSVAQGVLFREIYGDHPYARIDATPESVARIGREHLVTFHRDRYAADGALLVAVGDVDAATLRPLVETAFGGWRTGAAPPAPVPDPPAIPARRVLLVDRPGSSRTTIRIGFATVPRRDPDFAALSLAADLFGEGLSSPSFLDPGDRRGRTRGAYATVEESADRAPATVFAEVETAATGQALVELLAELRRLRTHAPPPDGLAAHRACRTRTLPPRLDPSLDLALRLAQAEIHRLPADDGSTDHDRIDAVTGEQVRAAAERFLDDRRAVIVVVGDAEELLEACRAVGPVTRTDLAGARDAPPTESP